jgi:hypothetical protein
LALHSLLQGLDLRTLRLFLRTLEQFCTMVCLAPFKLLALLSGALLRRPLAHLQKVNEPSCLPLYNGEGAGMGELQELALRLLHGLDELQLARQLHRQGAR